MSGPGVVLDTNVIVAAGFQPGSASAAIVDAVRAGRLRMAWNDATRREIEHILRRIPPLDAASAEALFREADRVTEPVDTAAFTAIADPDDRVFAAVAHAAGATLVTSDAHLLDARVPGLRVVPPGAFRAP